MDFYSKENGELFERFETGVTIDLFLKVTVGILYGEYTLESKEKTWVFVMYCCVTYYLEAQWLKP